MADTPIIDAHVHMWPRAHASSLRWCPSSHPLHARRCMPEYRDAAASSYASSLQGFVLIEADRTTKSETGIELLSSDWSEPLAELAFFTRLATGKPSPEDTQEGAFEADDAQKCLAIVPWAPIASGPGVLTKYLEEAEKVAGPEGWAKVKGFRYLLQDKPHGTMLTEEFVESLKLLGRRGFAFELGVDQHRRGKTQLEEAVELIDRAYDGVDEAEQVHIIINHMAKPNLEAISPAEPSFLAWRVAMYTLSKCAKTYIKVSGGLSELPPTIRGKSPEDIFLDIHSWLLVLLATFGPKRMIFASDWPASTVGVDLPEPGKEEQTRSRREAPDTEGESETETKDVGAWEKWRRVVARMAWMSSMEEEDQAMLFGGTAKKAYRIE